MTFLLALFLFLLGVVVGGVIVGLVLRTIYSDDKYEKYVQSVLFKSLKEQGLSDSQSQHLTTKILRKL